MLFGATGLAGSSVLKACLASPVVDEIRVITRRPVGISDGKLHEFVHHDFLNYSGVSNAFAGMDACFFCLGVSVMQVPGEAEYRQITHDFALAAAQEFEKNSPQATFHYISGQGTKRGSRMMWARVKAETERELIGMMKAVCWRPSFIDGDPSSTTPKVIRMLRPVLKVLKPFPGLYVEGQDLGRAMIQATIENVRGRVIENSEIRELASRHRSPIH
jgi:hypothetical protein